MAVQSPSMKNEVYFQ